MKNLPFYKVPEKLKGISVAVFKNEKGPMGVRVQKSYKSAHKGYVNQAINLFPNECLVIIEHLVEAVDAMKKEDPSAFTFVERAPSGPKPTTGQLDTNDDDDFVPF